MLPFLCVKIVGVSCAPIDKDFLQLGFCVYPFRGLE